MKKIILLFTTLLFFTMTACANGNSGPAIASAESTEDSGATMNITITIGTKTFSATLADNSTTHALVSQFPITLDMNELNGNEYYVYLDNSLPTAGKNPRTINAGDIKLYGSSCLVIFYKSFSTSYSYTDLGTISDTTGLLDALKKSGGKVTFTLAE
ncbi:cyclophilin-like fold protein [Treponema sp.]|uniref:cyclophilin-like fold protein n=1 Tax=Treponema sp. TaxID=166 RepID=UPI00388CF06F